SFNFGSQYNDAVRTFQLSSIDENQLNESLNVYPNPAKDNVTLTFDLNKSEKINIEIYDVMGKLVYTEDLGTVLSGNTIKNLNISHLNSGLYLVNIQAGNTIAVKKITVNK